jgi:hypothetical protein
MSRTALFALILLVMLPSVSDGAIPVVRFLAETERGAQTAEQCRQIWLEEGPLLAEELLPVGFAADTVTCLIFESNSFQEKFGGVIPDWGVGLAYPDGRTVALDYAGLPAVGRGVRGVFLHEMVHALLFQGAGEAWLPTWFHEGCAMRYSGEWRFSDTVSIILDGHVPSLDRLQGRFPASPATADRAYRTSLLAVTRLQDQYGPDIAARLVAAARRSGDFHAAFKEVTGITADEFTAEFAAAMKLRLGWLVMLTRWPSLFVLASLIFALGATGKMIRTRRRLAEMEEEERS